MPTKSFSIYNNGGNAETNSAGKLVIELGKHHVTIVTSSADKKAITGLEVFDISNIAASGDLFKSILRDSELLQTSYSNPSVFINNEFCVQVPIYKFNKEISEDYTNMVFGEDLSSTIFFEHLAIEPGIMNVFRINAGMQQFAAQLPNSTLHHTYSNILKRHCSNAPTLPEEFISVQFYNASIIVVVMKERKLQLVQTFSYENAEDVLYYLLNICKQFQLYTNTLTLHISGMIDLEFKLYRDIIKYFKQVSVDHVNTSVSIPPADEYPLHYFTPFFNLAI